MKFLCKQTIFLITTVFLSTTKANLMDFTCFQNPKKSHEGLLARMELDSLSVSVMVPEVKDPDPITFAVLDCEAPYTPDQLAVCNERYLKDGGYSLVIKKSPLKKYLYSADLFSIKHHDQKVFVATLWCR